MGDTMRKQFGHPIMFRKLAIVTLLLIAPQISFAGTLPGTIYTNTPFTPTCNTEDGIWFYDYIQDGYVDENGNYLGPDPSDEYTIPCGVSVTLQTVGQYDYGFCETWVAPYSQCQINSNGGTFTTQEGEQTQDLLLASSAGFLVSSTVADYGLYAFYFLTALIGIMVAYLIYLWGWSKAKKSLNDGKFDFIEHSADDLEFKRNYGQSKRKYTRESDPEGLEEYRKYLDSIS